MLPLKKEVYYVIPLLQLATDSHACLFRPNKFTLISKLAALFSDPNIIKVVVAIRDDIKELMKLNNFSARGFADLANLAMENDFQNFGLRALTAILCLGAVDVLNSRRLISLKFNQIFSLSWFPGFPI